MSPPPSLIFLDNIPTPYRLHLHRRVLREVPELLLKRIFTHSSREYDWQFHDMGEIETLFLDSEASRQSSPSGQLAEWRNGGAAIEWMTRRNARCVIVGGYNDLGRLRVAGWCRRRGIPCFLFGDSNIHCDVSRASQRRWKSVLLPRILDRFTGVLCCGSLGAAYFRRYGVAAERIFYSPYEPDYSQFLPPPDCPKVLRGSRRRSLITCCRLVAVKRVDLLLAAFERIAGSRPEWDLTVIGASPEEQNLKARVTPLLRDRVAWAGFVSEPAALGALYRSADVFVLASDYEPWGVVVNGAVASGLALVCSPRVGAAAELLSEGVNGRTFEAGNLDDLVQALLETTDPAALPRMKAASPQVLANWRTRADPIDGLRRAISFAGMLPGSAAGRA
ncbi:MAG: glycosyltransferase family 4 protein [Bryobacterales bacterium]|nr:glycosyltransferase family 4 protein [Bryobacterales bacterium]